MGDLLDSFSGLELLFEEIFRKGQLLWKADIYNQSPDEESPFFGGDLSTFLQNGGGNEEREEKFILFKETSTDIDKETSCDILNKGF
jgi:hypothetical protein